MLAFTLTTATPADNGQTVFVSQKTNQDGEVTIKQVPTGEITYEQIANACGLRATSDDSNGDCGC
ncbi:hypothetical protein QY882_01620 [Latilactobacillus sakei]